MPLDGFIVKEGGQLEIIASTARFDGRGAYQRVVDEISYFLEEKGFVYMPEDFQRGGWHRNRVFKEPEINIGYVENEFGEIIDERVSSQKTRWYGSIIIIHNEKERLVKPSSLADYPTQWARQSWQNLRIKFQTTLPNMPALNLKGEFLKYH